MQAGAAKTAPNSLCRAVANYGELCAALRGTAWEADLLPIFSEAERLGMLTGEHVWVTTDAVGAA